MILCPKLFRLSLFEPFRADPNEKSGFYPETEQKTFSGAQGCVFMRTYYYQDHLESHQRQPISSVFLTDLDEVKHQQFCWSTRDHN